MKVRAFDIRSRLMVSHAVLLFFMLLLAFLPLWASWPGADGWHLLPGAIMVLLGLLIAFWSIRSIVHPFEALVRQAGHLANKDVSQVPARYSRGDLGQLERSLEQIGHDVFKVVADVRLGTTSVASTSDMIIADGQALSERTEAQAGSLQQTASSLEELTSNVRGNAENAEVANQLARNADQLAGEGSALSGRLIELMDDIRRSSERIKDIIAVIDGIAFQTNILALNASVEAARAGSHGRGFAVVAAEVRELAHHSARAAREIKGLIIDSVDKIGRGHQLVRDSGTAMEEIAESIKRVLQLIGDIAAAGNEQSVAIAEVSRTVTQLDETTQRNASMVVETTRVADGLKDQAISLSQTVGSYVLGEREFGNAEEAKKMVQSAIEFMRLRGRHQAIEEVRKLAKGRFIDRDLYLIVYGFNGQIMAHGSNRRLWGADWTRIADADGKFFNKEMTQKLKTAPSGWTDYRWLHPLSRKLQVKSAYFEQIEDLFFVCGYYKRQ